MITAISFWYGGLMIFIFPAVSTNTVHRQLKYHHGQWITFNLLSLLYYEP